jgi:hypothetical protein
MVERVLQRMTVMERIVYECNRRDVYLEKLALMEGQEEEIRRTKAQEGERYTVAGDVLLIPPWATEEFQAQFKGFRVASAQETRMDVEDKREVRPKFSKRPVDPDWDLHWDDEPILLSVREMMELLDGTKADEPGYPRSVQEMAEELKWVFGSMLQKGEEFKERQERYRRSKHRERGGC